MEEGRSDEHGNHPDVEPDRTHKATAKLLLGGYGMGFAGHNRWSTESPEGYWLIGCVTMLMLVMPACLTASMTEANAPKGTFSSART